MLEKTVRIPWVTVCTNCGNTIYRRVKCLHSKDGVFCKTECLVHWEYNWKYRTPILPTIVRIGGMGHE